MLKGIQKPLLGQQINWAHPLSKGLGGCWVMNEGSGGKIYDLSGNGNNGALGGQISEFSWKAGNKGTVIDFVGNTQTYFDHGLIQVADGKPWSFVFECQLDGDTNEGIIFGDRTGASYIWLSEGQSLYFDGISNAYHFSSVKLFTKWHIYSLVCDGQNLSLYVDGNFEAKDPASSGAYGFDFRYIGCGYNSDAYMLDGRISFASLYNHAFTTQEIAWLHREPYAMFKQDDAFILRQLKGTVCWGHHTAVVEDHDLNFTSRWTGDGSIQGTAGLDNERIVLAPSKYMESETWDMGGACTAIIEEDHYQVGAGVAILQYKQGATKAACEAAAWQNYVGAFACGRWVKVKTIG